jgi:polysaccharide biosynthesis transport protein
MEPASALSLPPRELVRLVWMKRHVWIATAAVCGLLAAAYSLVMPRYWEASQGMIVRQETAGSVAARPGKFTDLYEMRTLQETILELAKSQQVVVKTICAVDGSDVDPSLEEIEKFRKRLKMLPPDGGEFGKTEVFYFSVRASSRERAMQLVGELCKQLEIALKALRAERAAGLVAELEEQRKLAEEMLDVETQRLMEFESQVGADLGELRTLHSANAGQSDVRMEAVQLEADVRKFRTQVREIEQLIALLRAAQDDPQQLVATPNSLLTAQPALRRLKDGLVDAQLATSRLGGTRSPDHPRVRAAAESERQIRSELHDELLTAIRGAEVELELGQDRLAATEERLGNLQQRFARLAEERAEY